jgi:predicted peroxiredoxin
MGATVSDLPAGFRVKTQPQAQDDLPPGFRVAGPSWTDTAVDAAKSFGTGVAEGAIDLVGLPGTLKDAADSAVGWALEKTIGPRPEGVPERQHPLSGRALKGYAENVTGEFYKPKTTAGEYASTVGQFVPGAAIGGGSLVGNIAKYGVLPGVASETAGQMTEGTALEPYARAGAALATGAGAAYFSRPSTAQGALREAAQGIDNQTAIAAQQLMDDARRMGVPLTLDEAVQQITNNGTRLSAIRRVVDNSEGGADTMARFAAQRPGQVQAAGSRAIDAVGPTPANPYSVGPRVQAAADDYLNKTRQAINRFAEPNYSALAGQRMPAQEYARISANPSYKAALQELRKNKELAPLLKGEPDDSVLVVNEVVKRLGTRIENVKPSAMNPAADPTLAGVRTGAKVDADTVARAASSDYAKARDLVEQGSRVILDPLKQGPLGKLAQTDDFAAQASTVLPPNPLPGSAGEIRGSLRAVSAKDPEAARALVSQRLRQVFNEATQSNVAGPNAWGGAKFASTIRGNTEQAAALKEAVEAVSPGSWNGFNRFIDVLEATGRRPNAGSMTEFNRQITQEMKRGGLLSGAAANAASPGKLTGLVREAYENWRFGRNTEQLAALLTRPDAAAQLARIARLPPDSPRAQAIAAALLANTTQAAQPRLPAPSQP